MRLGGPCLVNLSDPVSWAAELKRYGYRATNFPFKVMLPEDVLRDYVKIAEKEDIMIAEVGAWSNPLSPDAEERKSAIAYCKERLELADRIGARCCVNVAGTRAENRKGPHQDNFSDKTFEMIVDTVRDIIDSVNPVRTYYALETMPWIYPDSADSYVDLIKAIDRKQFAVHLDPVNIINCPRAYFNNAEIIKECFLKLGPYIKSCHAKDILLSNKLTVHLDEVRPGLGGLDYEVYLKEISKIDKDTPLLLEHLHSEEEYMLAEEYIRNKLKEIQ